jgi:CRISPR-associated protein Cas1
MLRCLRSKQGAEHPLSVFHAVFLFARGGIPKDQWPVYVFHPLSATGRRVRKDASYRLAVVFAPTTPSQVIQRFADSLVSHLADPRNNFAITEGPIIESVDWAARVHKHLTRLADHDEVCLQFDCPFPFVPESRERPWLLPPELLRRSSQPWLERFAGEPLPWIDSLPWDRLRILPWYWQTDYVNHRSGTPGSGKSLLQVHSGWVGNLYLRGPIAAFLPFLCLAEEWHLGGQTRDKADDDGQGGTVGRNYGFRGAFRLLWDVPALDPRLLNPADHQRAWNDRRESSDPIDEALDGEMPFLDKLLDDVRHRRFVARPATRFDIPKDDGDGCRHLARLDMPDRWLHAYLHELLAPVFDRMFEAGSMAFRRGRSIETARQSIVQAWNDGHTWAATADIERFFDEIDWDLLEERLAAALPRADARLLAALRACIRTPLALPGGKPVARDRGLLQGSPLSPLLANLYLDPFDEAMAGHGIRMVRYADDFILLARDREAAERALALAAAELSAIGLSLQPDKSAVHRLDLGFSFLGMDIGGRLDEEAVDRVLLRRPLYIREQFGFLGLDGGALVFRKRGELLARVPLARVSEIVVLGTASLSTWLLHRCTRDRIPVTLCSPTGYYVSTLHPDSQAWHAVSARHLQAFQALGDAGRLAVARRLVAAKLGAYLAWVRQDHGADAALIRELETAAAKALDADLDALRGHEGHAAKLLFTWVNGRVRVPEFQSPKRLKRHARADRYNSLLNFGYYLLFSRLNVLLRARGLNPYLGFLHSHLDNFESLVCDLQEPFRCRVDRLVVKIVNLRIVKPDDFEPTGPDLSQRLHGPAVGRFIQAFERELTVRLVGDSAALGDLVAAQTVALLRWTDGKELAVLSSGAANDTGAGTASTDRDDLASSP